MKETLRGRTAHLLSSGHVLPVGSYIRKRLEKLDTDIALIRYFVTEVLDVIAPPYTSDRATFPPHLGKMTASRAPPRRRVNMSP